jgi:hypothetical protein
MLSSKYECGDINLSKDVVGRILIFDIRVSRKQIFFRKLQDISTSINQILTVLLKSRSLLINSKTWYVYYQLQQEKRRQGIYNTPLRTLEKNGIATAESEVLNNPTGRNKFIVFSPEEAVYYKHEPINTGC